MYRSLHTHMSNFVHLYNVQILFKSLNSSTGKLDRLQCRVRCGQNKAVQRFVFPADLILDQTRNLLTNLAPHHHISQPGYYAVPILYPV